MNELKKLRKLPTLRGLADMTGSRRQRKELPQLPSGINEQFDTTNDLELKLAHALKDDRLAKRVVNLMENKYPYGTVPELIMLDYLQSKQERYKYQAELFGGWRGGGLIPDFVVSQGGASLALLINGTYWHNVPGKREKDAADKLRIMNSYFDGELITDVVIVWESRLMEPGRQLVMANALAGQELPP